MKHKIHKDKITLGRLIRLGMEKQNLEEERDDQSSHKPTMDQPVLGTKVVP